jgi:lactate dehydrogenase-like 2-hydroxyacid dehydrogenase
MTKPRVLVALPLPEDLLGQVAAECEPVRAPGGPFPTPAELAELMPTVDGVVTTVMARFDAGLLPRCPRLRVISNCAVGLDNIDIAAATKRRIAVCNTPGLQNTAAAELTIALILALARNLVVSDRFVRSGEWQQKKGGAGLGVNIRGKRLGLIGMGGIGRSVAAAASALGMEVVYCKPTEDRTGIARRVGRDEVFTTADFVSIHAPLTAETRGSIGAREFALMKPTAYLINTARGAIVDEAALAAALRAGRPAAAALDVMAEEPLPAASPLCGLANVILQPHAAGATRETRRAMEELAVANLLAVLRGERPRAIVNPEVLG